MSCPSCSPGEKRARHQTSAPELLELPQLLGRLGSDSSGVTSSSGGRRVSGYRPPEAAGTDPVSHPARGSDPAGQAELEKRCYSVSQLTVILLCGMRMGTVAMLPRVIHKCPEAPDSCQNIHLQSPLPLTFTLTVTHRALLTDAVSLGGFSASRQ